MAQSLHPSQARLGPLCPDSRMEIKMETIRNTTQRKHIIHWLTSMALWRSLMMDYPVNSHKRKQYRERWNRGKRAIVLCKRIF